MVYVDNLRRMENLLFWQFTLPLKKKAIEINWMMKMLRLFFVLPLPSTDKIWYHTIFWMNGRRWRQQLSYDPAIIAGIFSLLSFQTQRTDDQWSFRIEQLNRTTSSCCHNTYVRACVLLIEWMRGRLFFFFWRIAHPLVIPRWLK